MATRDAFRCVAESMLKKLFNKKYKFFSYLVIKQFELGCIRLEPAAI